MIMPRSIPLSLAGAITLALFGTASIASAQTPPPAPPAAPMPAQPPMPPPPPAAPAQPQTPMRPSTAQMPAQPPMPPSATETNPLPPSRQQTASAPFYPGTKSSATYPIQHGTLTVNAGMPAHVQSYGPPPPFKTLDSNHDGRIGESEAQAYPPLDSDFLYVSGGAKSISHAQYSRWAKAQR